MIEICHKIMLPADPASSGLLYSAHCLPWYYTCYSEARECLLLLGVESLVFQFAIHNFKDQDTRWFKYDRD